MVIPPNIRSFLILKTNESFSSGTSSPSGDNKSLLISDSSIFDTGTV